MAACSPVVHTQELLQDLDLDGIWVRDPWRLERHCDVAPGGPGIEMVGLATRNSSEFSATWGQTKILSWNHEASVAK